MKKMKILRKIFNWCWYCKIVPLSWCLKLRKLIERLEITKFNKKYAKKKIPTKGDYQMLIGYYSAKKDEESFNILNALCENYKKKFNLDPNRISIFNSTWKSYSVDNSHQTN